MLKVLMGQCASSSSGSSTSSSMSKNGQRDLEDVMAVVKLAAAEQRVSCRIIVSCRGFGGKKDGAEGHFPYLRTMRQTMSALFCCPPQAPSSPIGKFWAKKRVGVTAEASVSSTVTVVPKSDRTKAAISGCSARPYMLAHAHAC